MEGETKKESRGDILGLGLNACDSSQLSLRGTSTSVHAPRFSSSLSSSSSSTNRLAAPVPSSFCPASLSTPRSHLFLHKKEEKRSPSKLELTEFKRQAQKEKRMRQRRQDEEERRWRKARERQRKLGPYCHVGAVLRVPKKNEKDDLILSGAQDVVTFQEEVRKFM